VAVLNHQLDAEAQEPRHALVGPEHPVGRDLTQGKATNSDAITSSIASKSMFL
jgi:hypothetical protein